MIKKNIESNSSDRTKGKALNEMKYYEIISAQEAIVNELAKHIRANKPEQFTELKQLADEYMEFAKEYDTRDIGQEARETIGI